MQCRNHAEVEAIDRCSGCAEGFCHNCLVEVHGQKYCSSCKVMAVKGRPDLQIEPTVPLPQAGEALTLAIVSIFCFGIILAPIALAKASKAQRLIQEDPRLMGSGKLLAATVIAWSVLGIWILGVLAKATAPGR